MLGSQRCCDFYVDLTVGAYNFQRCNGIPTPPSVPIRYTRVVPFTLREFWLHTARRFSARHP